VLTIGIKPVLNKDDKAHTLLIGKPAKEAGSHYAKRGNDAAVFTVSDQTFESRCGEGGSPTFASR
jgi:hypothetical protein